MISWFKDETGSTMGMVMILILIISVVGISVGQYIYNTNKQSQRNLNSVQAHYYAKSGVETAMGLVTANYDPLVDDDRYALNGVLNQSYYGSIDGTFTTTVKEPADHNIEFTITLDGDDERGEVIINSVGIVRTGSNSVASSENLAYTITLSDLRSVVGGGANGGTGTPIALFTMNSLEMSGSPSITGSVATNTKKNNSVIFGWSTYIRNGDLFIGKDANPVNVIKTDQVQNYSIDNPYVHPNVVEPNIVKNLSHDLVFGLPTFPDFDSELHDVQYVEKLETSWEGPKKIDSDGHYGEINVTSSRKVIIDLNESTRKIRVGSLNIEQGEIELINVGDNGKLILYVEDDFILGGSSKVNENGKHTDVVMYYSGTEKINAAGATVFKGSLYAENADIVIGGSGGITGDIITGGTSVIVSGAANAQTRVLYAPLAKLDISGSGSIKGTAVVSDTKLAGGGTQIQADESLDLSFFNSLNWSGGKAPSLSIGGLEQEGEGIWQGKGYWSLVTDG